MLLEGVEKGETLETGSALNSNLFESSGGRANSLTFYEEWLSFAVQDFDSGMGRFFAPEKRLLGGIVSSRCRGSGNKRAGTGVGRVKSQTGF
jgi:hypothetical protein